MAAKFITPALALASYAFAQCSVSGTTTIQNGGDATALAACSTFSGSIAIATDAANSIQINSVRAITGDLVSSNNNQMYSLGGDSLETIGGTLSLTNDTSLSSVTMPRLTSVGSIMFNALPQLQGLGFTSGLTQAKTLDIQNTFLTSLNGINLQTVNSITIVNNPLLQDMSFQVTKVSGSIQVGGNGDRISVAFPNLQTAQNLSLSNIPTLSIPALANVTGNLGFYSNGFSSISTPNLTLVSQTLDIKNNDKLGNLTMTQLKTIGGALNVNNNGQLTDLGSTFPALTTISSVNMTGAFTAVKMPALKDNKGAFSIVSTGDINNDCNTFKAEAGPNNVIKGKFTCMPKADSTTAGTATSGSTSSSPKSDAGRLDVSSNAAIGIGSVLVAMFGLL